MFASALSVVALPAIWLANDDEDGSRTGVPQFAAVGLEAEVGPHTSTVTNQLADPMMPQGSAPEPLFLTGPSAGPGPGNMAVATPAPDGDTVELDATFARSVSWVDLCRVNGVPDHVEVTVTNLENGRSVHCWSAPLSSGRADLIVLHPDRFQHLADFTDAPVHVDVSW